MKQAVTLRFLGRDPVHCIMYHKCGINQYVVFMVVMVGSGMHISVPLHIWLATLLIVMPVPDSWVKVAIAVICVMIVALIGG